jgi:hypothetical protein
LKTKKNEDAKKIIQAFFLCIIAKLTHIPLKEKMKLKIKFKKKTKEAMIAYNTLNASKQHNVKCMLHLKCTLIP